MFKILKYAIAPFTQEFHYENQPNPHCSSPFMVTISFSVYTLATSMWVTDVGDKFEMSGTDLRC